MARQILTTWGEFQSGIDRLLELARDEIQIYDGDLSRLALDSTARLDRLKALLHPHRQGSVRIALQDVASLQTLSPRLMALLRNDSGSMTIAKTPESLDFLRDTMILADGRHGLVLVERSQARAKLLIDESEEIKPYLRRFEDIWAEDISPVLTTTLGL